MKPPTILKKYFGYDNFRPGQIEIVDSICSGQDTLALLPTGGGKSVCFQVPGMVLGGTTLVISPLISLMKDQVDTLNRKGMAATYINSSLSSIEIETRLNKLQAGEYNFVYAAPERLTNSRFIKICQNLHLPLIAIDEAHCISQWGHDFRPEYQQINLFVEQLSHRPVIAAFTATATPAVQTDIVSSLKLADPQIFARSFKRSNLTLHSITCQNQVEKNLLLLFLVKKYTGLTGVIYATTRLETESVADFLKSMLKNIGPIAFYHGGMSTEQRSKVQEDFLTNKTQIIVATNAFGMGVDKPDVRFVIHYQIPSTLENYYQEAGRAGRDGQPANCYLLYHSHDVLINHEFIHSTQFKSETIKANNLNKLKLMVQYAEVTKCRNKFLMEYFGEKWETQNCGQCDACVEQALSINDQQAQYFFSLVQFQKQMALEYRVSPTQVMTRSIMYYLTLAQPQTQTAFLEIPGIGQGWIEQWYERLSDFLSANSHLP